MMHRALMVVVCALVMSGTTMAQSGSARRDVSATIFLVRHAERADTSAGKPAVAGSDPSLSDAGHSRARSLATMLRDAGIRAVFVTEYKRTQETAAPLAAAIGVTPIVMTSKDLEGLLAKLEGATGNVLVVGHSNSVPEVIKGLGVTTPVTIADTEFDHLFIVTPGRQLIRLRYR
jgi:broad specificity phosphatase PhoE